MEQVRAKVICTHHLVRSGILGTGHQRCLDTDSTSLTSDDNFVTKSLYDGFNIRLYVESVVSNELLDVFFDVFTEHVSAKRRNIFASNLTDDLSEYWMFS